MASAAAAFVVAAEASAALRAAHTAALAEKDTVIAELEAHLSEFSRVVESLRANGATAEALAAERVDAAEAECDVLRTRVDTVERGLRGARAAEEEVS